MRMTLALLTVGMVVTAASLNAAEKTKPAAKAADPLMIVVMDPLAAPLSCPCVQGYAQRDYKQLAEHLTKRLGRPVDVAFSESLTHALEHKSKGRADIVIGKESVVKFDAKTNDRKLAPIARLSDKKGMVTMKGLIVVPSTDAAKTVADLKGYRIIFGPAECDEKHSAALALLKLNGVPAPEKLETNAACSDGATLILEQEPGAHGAAVISSYAAPLLEGCGTIKKGDLRVVGETKSVPFITAFVSETLDKDLQDRIRKELLDVADNAELCVAIESRDGFVAFGELPKSASDEPETAEAKKK